MPNQRTPKKNWNSAQDRWAGGILVHDREPFPPVRGDRSWLNPLAVSHDQTTSIPQDRVASD
jgi:hypothetical protein